MDQSAFTACFKIFLRFPDDNIWIAAKNFKDQKQKSFKKSFLDDFIYKTFVYKIYMCVHLCVSKMSLALNTPQDLICHKTWPTHHSAIIYIYIYIQVVVVAVCMRGYVV